MRGLCHGGCPKDRFVASRDGEPGHNYLCDGLYKFFAHTRPTMTVMAPPGAAGEVRGRGDRDVCAEDAKRGRNDPCPCGNGKKFKACHGSPG